MLFYADENFPLAVTEHLRQLGHDVLTAGEDGRANRAVTDESVLGRATELKRAVLTINRRDFRLLHEVNALHAGIVICTQDADFTGQASRIDEACAHIANIAGRLVRVYRPSK